MSDIYAMGGQVLFAINLVSFPDDLGMDLLSEILRGGAEKVAEAGGVIAGGHSVTDKEPKYGLAVTGTIHPSQIKAKGGAQPRDLLVLTKPLGVGVVTTALKKDIAEPDEIAAAVRSMKTLNRQAATAAQLANAHSMTDITGFGLLGHAREMALSGSVDFHFNASQLPWLPGAMRLGKAGAFPGGTQRNESYFAPAVHFDDSVSPRVRNLLFTPETSGGLLIALPPENLKTLQDNCETAQVVGQVAAGPGQLHVG